MRIQLNTQYYIDINGGYKCMTPWQLQQRQIYIRQYFFSSNSQNKNILQTIENITNIPSTDNTIYKEKNPKGSSVIENKLNSIEIKIINTYRWQFQLYIPECDILSMLLCSFGADGVLQLWDLRPKLLQQNN